MPPVNLTTHRPRPGVSLETSGRWFFCGFCEGVLFLRGFIPGLLRIRFRHEFSLLGGAVISSVLVVDLGVRIYPDQSLCLRAGDVAGRYGCVGRGCLGLGFRCGCMLRGGGWRGFRFRGSCLGLYWGGLFAFGFGGSLGGFLLCFCCC